MSVSFGRDVGDERRSGSEGGKQGPEEVAERPSQNPTEADAAASFQSRNEHAWSRASSSGVGVRSRHEARVGSGGFPQRGQGVDYMANANPELETAANASMMPSGQQLLNGFLKMRLLLRMTLDCFWRSISWKASTRPQTRKSRRGNSPRCAAGWRMSATGESSPFPVKPRCARCVRPSSAPGDILLSSRGHRGVSRSRPLV